MAEITLKNLKIGYPPCVLVETDELNLVPGEALPIVGDNGAGKSTFLRTLAGLQQQVEGDIYYNRQLLNHTSLQELSFLRAFLFTERPHQAWLKTEDILRWSLPGGQELDLNFLQEIVGVFNISDFLKREFVNLSDGQKQKVMLARAFIQDTPVLFLDEPTIFLDIRVKFHILELIERLARERNKLILYSTHEWSWVCRGSRELLHLDAENRVLERTSSRELIDRGIYPEA